MKRKDEHDAAPGLAFSARVRMERLHVEQIEGASVTVHEGVTVHRTDRRRNLPAPLAPGGTHHDAGLTYHLSVRAGVPPGAGDPSRDG